jgi:hypothetical protein
VPNGAIISVPIGAIYQCANWGELFYSAKWDDLSIGAKCGDYNIMPIGAISGLHLMHHLHKVLILISVICIELLTFILVSVLMFFLSCAFMSIYCIFVV